MAGLIQIIEGPHSTGKRRAARRQGDRLGLTVWSGGAARVRVGSPGMAFDALSRPCPVRALAHRRLLGHAAGRRDPREGWRVVYPLREVLLVALCAALCGVDDVAEVELWGEARPEFLPCSSAVRARHPVPGHAQGRGAGHRRGAVQSVLCRVGRPAARRPARRHRWRDVAPLPRHGQGMRVAPSRVGLGSASASGARPGSDGRQVERDHGRPAAARTPRTGRRRRYHRCSGSPDQDRAEDPRPRVLWEPVPPRIRERSPGYGHRPPHRA